MELEQFQKSDAAWEPARLLLVLEEVVRYFAAQTFVAKLRAGKVPDPGFDAQVLAALPLTSGATQRMLAVALADAGLGGNRLNIVAHIQALSSDWGACMAVVRVFPEEATNTSVAIDAATRSAAVEGLLPVALEVFGALASRPIDASILESVSSWLKLHMLGTEVRRARKT